MQSPVRDVVAGVRRRVGGVFGRPTASDDYEAHVRRLAATGQHRDASGGLWDTVGPMVAEYLVGQGLEPANRFLDIGCGALRVGVHVVDYLDAGNYFGVDRSEDLLDAGYDIELNAAGLTPKVPRGHLVAEADFRFGSLADGELFDVALAQSVFTHLPIGHLRLCLGRLAPVMRPGGVFHATFLLAPDLPAWLEADFEQPAGFSTHPDRDPFHHLWDDVVHAADGLGWTVEGPDDLLLPRGQLMARFTRVDGPG